MTSGQIWPFFSGLPTIAPEMGFNRLLFKIKWMSHMPEIVKIWHKD